MLEKILKKIFGDKNSQDLKRYEPMVSEINEIYSGLEQYEDEQLIARVQEIKQEITQGISIKILRERRQWHAIFTKRAFKRKISRPVRC